jgi:hypothetical protein
MKRQTENNFNTANIFEAKDQNRTEEFKRNLSISPINQAIKHYFSFDE